MCAPSSSRPLLTGFKTEGTEEEGVCHEGLGLWDFLTMQELLEGGDAI